MGSGIKKRESKLFMKKFLDEYDTDKKHRAIRNEIEGELSRAIIYPQDPIFKNFKFVIFEGGDFSGKSTQAERLAQHYNKCMVVHFPRTTKINPMSYRSEDSSPLHTVSKSTKDVYEHTNNWLYNENFWIDFFYVLEMCDKRDGRFAGSDFDKKDKILRNCLESNIFYNYIDKVYFFVELANFIRGDNKSLEFSDDYSFYMNGKQVTDKESINEIIDSYRNQDQEHVIVFDRFILSGKIYNSYIPKMWIINKFVNHFNTYNIKDQISVEEMVKLIKNKTEAEKLTATSIEFDKYARKLFDDNFYQFNYMCNLLSTITEKQSECDKKLVEYLNNLSGFNVKYTDYMPSFELYDWFNKHYKSFKNNTLNTNFINVNCYRSEKLLESIKQDAISSNRKVDAYDKNTLMQEVVNRYFDECKKMSKDLSSPIQNVNVFKTGEDVKENLYLNTLNIDSDMYYEERNPKEGTIDNISACISIYIYDYKPSEDNILVSYNRSRDSITYMNY